MHDFSREEKKSDLGQKISARISQLTVSQATLKAVARKLLS